MGEENKCDVIVCFLVSVESECLDFRLEIFSIIFVFFFEIDYKLYIFVVCIFFYFKIVCFFMDREEN